MNNEELTFQKLVETMPYSKDNRITANSIKYLLEKYAEENYDSEFIDTVKIVNFLEKAYGYYDGENDIYHPVFTRMLDKEIFENEVPLDFCISELFYAYALENGYTEEKFIDEFITHQHNIEKEAYDNFLQSKREIDSSKRIK